MAKKKSKGKATSTEPTEIPEFFDAEGQLKTLKRKDFPNSKDGQIAYCDYQVERWKVKKVAVEKRLDPLAKKKKRREKLMEQLEKLNAELEDSSEE